MLSCLGRWCSVGVWLTLPVITGQGTRFGDVHSGGGERPGYAEQDDGTAACGWP